MVPILRPLRHSKSMRRFYGAACVVLALAASDAAAELRRANIVVSDSCVDFMIDSKGRVWGRVNPEHMRPPGDIRGPLYSTFLHWNGAIWTPIPRSSSPLFTQLCNQGSN